MPPPPGFCRPCNHRSPPLSADTDDEPMQNEVKKVKLKPKKVIKMVTR